MATRLEGGEEVGYWGGGVGAVGEDLVVGDSLAVLGDAAGYTVYCFEEPVDFCGWEGPWENEEAVFVVVVDLRLCGDVEDRRCATELKTFLRALIRCIWSLQSVMRLTASKEYLGGKCRKDFTYSSGSVIGLGRK